MRTVAAALLSACLVHFCQASVAPADCQPSTPDPCRFIPESQILVSEGKCSETSSVTCETWKRQRDAYKEAFVDWLSDGTMVCDKNVKSVATKSVARAIAEVWTSFAKNVECVEGQSFACGWSFVDADVIAGSVAEAIKDAALRDAPEALKAAGSENAEVVEVFCHLDILAIKGTLTKAAATAAEDTCGFSGGDPVSRYTESYAAAIETAIAEVIDFLLSPLCLDESGEVDRISTSGRCDGDFVSGDDLFYCYLTDRVTPPLCCGIVAEKCCTDKPRRFCRIRRKDCRTCNSPYRRYICGDEVIFQDKKGDFCICEPN